MNTENALSTVDHVLAASDRFFQIADVVHRRLTGGPIDLELVHSTADLYGLLVEEYGLRARAAILRNDAAAHVVVNTTLGQTELLETLEKAREEIARLDKVTQLRSLVATVSTLCVGISPNKGRIVDFLVMELQAEIIG